MKLLVDEAVPPVGQLDVASAVDAPDALLVDQAIAPPPAKWGDVMSSALPTAAGILQQAVGGGMRALGETTGMDTVGEAGAGIAESGQINIREARPEGMSLGQEFVQQGVANVGAMAPSLLAGAAFGVPAVLAGAGITAFGPTYQNSREAKLGVGRSLLHGAVDSVIEVGTELLPARYLFGAAGAPLLQRLRNAIVADYGGEIAATILQDMNAKASYNPEMTVRDLVNDVVMTMGSQLVSSPLTAGFGAAAAGTVGGLRKLQERSGVTPERPEVAGESGRIPAQNPPGVTPTAPITVYHGTPAQFDDFRGEFTHFALSAKDAEGYRLRNNLDPDNAGRIVTRTINPKNVADADTVAALGKELFGDEDVLIQADQDSYAFIQELKKRGYDAARYWDQDATTGDPIEALIVLDKELLKRSDTDLMKTRWVQEHAESAGYAQVGQRIMAQDPNTRPMVQDATGADTNVPLSDVDMKPGDVIVAGPYWEGHTEEYMKLVQKEAQAFVKEVMGNKIAMVLATGLPQNAAGVAVTGFATDGMPIAYVNPRHLYDSMLQRKAEGRTSLHAEAEAQYSLYHEFGHVLRQFAMQDSTAPQQAAVEADFKAAAEQVLSKQINATDFLLRYSSPWKIAKGFGLNDYGGAKGEWTANAADRFVQFIVSNKVSPDPNMDVSHVSALSFLETLAKRTGGKSWQDVWNFDEFVGDQHARWMRSTKRAQTGPLGQFFTDMNALMQKYFNWLVRTKRVGKPSDLGPTEAYKKFVNRLVTANKTLVDPQIATPEILKKAKKNAKKLYYELNPDGSETHNPEYASLTAVEMQQPKVIEVANRWLRQYGPTKTPFFTMWAGNWELAKAVNLMYSGAASGNSEHVGLARRHMRDLKVRLETAKRESEHLLIGDELHQRLDSLIQEVDAALEGRPPIVQLIRDVTGNPLIVYHGTNLNWKSNSFQRAKAGQGVGGTDTKQVWFATPDPRMANTYAMHPYTHPAHVMKLFLRGSKILQVPSTEISSYETDSYLEAIANARDEGADVIHFEKVYDYGFESYAEHHPELRVEPSGAPMFMFFNGHQVKSAWGNMTFAPDSHLLWDRSSAVAMGDEEPLRKLTTNDPQIDVTPYLNAGRVIRKKWWLLEQLRHVGIDLRSFEVNLQQWQHIAQRLNGLPFVQRFVDLSRAFTEEKNLNVKFASETVVNGYKQLGKTQLEHLRKILEWETDGKSHKTEIGDGYLPDGRPAKVRHIADRAAFASEVQKALGFTPDSYTIDYFERIRTAMHNQLEALYTAAAEKAGVATGMVDNILGEFGDLLVDAKSEDLQKLQGLLDTPQYPWSRFGKYAIIIEKKVTDDKGNVSFEPVHYRHFEFSRDRDNAFKALRLDTDQRGRVFDYFNDYVGFSVIPQSFIDVVIRRAGFDPNSPQADELRALAAVQRNTNLFKRFEEDFKLTDRSEHDALKDFADFSGHLAALTAKVKYRRHLSLAVAEARKAVSLLDSQGVNSSDMQLLHQYMHQQLEYGMTPQDELQGLRSFITKAMLFGNVRAAAVNTTSVLNTAAYLDGLVAKYNVLSWPSLLPLVKSAIQAVGTINQLNNRITPEELRFLQDLESRGVTDQSYSYHLAAAADSGVMYRLNRSKSKYGTKVIETGMLPFRAVERYTRRVGALTAYRVAKAHPEILEGKTPEEFAKDALYLTQADYTAFNRPRSQQGLKAAALIFFTYTQNMVALFGGTLGGATSARLFLIYGMLGGLMGLPFAEDLMNMSNWVWRRLFKGDTDLRVAAREVANGIPGLGPVLLRGVMHNIGGFDLSHSVSLGRVIPGLDSFAQSNMKSVDESFGSFAFDLMGPMGGYARGWLQAGAAMVNEPGVQSAIRLAQAAAPSQRSLFDLALFAEQSGSMSQVQGYAGQIITKEDDGSVRELTTGELLGKALGFNPEIVARNREVDFLQRETATFWTQRRKHFMDLHWQAVQLRDPEMRADVREAIAAFNASVPDRHLRISSEDVQRSMKQRERIRSLEERGKSPIKRYQTLYSDVEAAFGS